MRVLLLFLILFCYSAGAQRINTTLAYTVQSPANKRTDPPVLILLHGYGSNELDLFSLAPEIGRNFLVFALRGPLPAGNGGFCWFPLEFLPGQKFRYNYKTAVQSREKIISFITDACREYKADIKKVFVLGFSQGAIMAYDLAVAHPGKIKGVLALSGRMMPETDELKTDRSLFAGISFFVAHGTEDNIVRYADGKNAAELIRKKGATRVKFRSYDAPHTITRQELSDIRNWLAAEAIPKAIGKE